VNLWIGTGRLTRDVELRYTPTGKSLTNFSVAINEGKDKEGNGLVTFVECEAWGTTAEMLFKFFGDGKGKGRPLTVRGRLKMDKWEDKNDGSARSKMRVSVDRFDFVPRDSTSLDIDADSEVAEETPKSPTKNKNKKQTQPEPESEEYEDDIPF
jgi:single-strand DNA-binding protein